MSSVAAPETSLPGWLVRVTFPMISQTQIFAPGPQCPSFSSGLPRLLALVRPFLGKKRSVESAPRISARMSPIVHGYCAHRVSLWFATCSPAHKVNNAYKPIVQNVGNKMISEQRSPSNSVDPPVDPPGRIFRPGMLSPGRSKNRQTIKPGTAWLRSRSVPAGVRLAGTIQALFFLRQGPIRSEEP